jgi:hypothetical protein
MPDNGRVAVADAFRRIILQPNNVTISADDVDDGLTLTAGNFIEFVPNESGDSIQINASSTISAAFEGGNVPLVTNFQNTQASTSTTTGAVRITGGLGVGGAIYASSIQATPIGSTTKASGGFTTLTATGTTTLEGTVNVNGLDVNTSLTPLGTGTVTINPNTVGTIDKMNIGATTRGTGAFTTLSANSTATLTGAVDINGSNVNTTISPTGTGTVTIQPVGGLTINPTAAGTINNTSIGASTRSTGAFTTLTANNATTLTANTGSTDTTTGTLVVTGGVGVSENLNVGGTSNFTGSVTLTGDIAVNGGDLTSTSATFNLINSNATTVNFAGAGTAITIGSTSGYSDIRNELRVTTNTVSSSTSTGALIVTGGVGIGGSVYASAGNFGSLTSTGTVSLSPANANVTASPTGTGTVTINPATSGNINNMAIGGSTAAAGTFTSLTANGATNLNPANNDVNVNPTGTGKVVINPAAAGTIDNVNIGVTTRGSGNFTTLNSNNNVTFDGTNSTVSIQPTGTGTATFNPATTGTINNMSIGATTRSTGAFTSLAANNTVTLDTTTNNQSYTTTGAGTITISSGTTGSIDNMTVGATIAASGRFTTVTSTIATGTAPFTVSSTTKVDNLQANSASKLHTARSIALSGFITGSASFDGTSDITINTTSGGDVIALGTSTVGQYASTIAVSGNGLTATTPNADDGTAYTITSNATNANTPGTIVFREAVTGNFSAGTISAAISASTISASSTVTFNPLDANISIQPTGTGTVTINPATVGTINNTSIGASTRSTGAFTTLESNGQTRFTANITSTNTTTGTLVVTGGIGASGSIRSGATVSAGTGSFGGVSCNALTFSSGISASGLRSALSGYSLVADGFYQFAADTQTDTDITSLLWPFSNGYSYVRISCIAIYENDFAAPTARARLHKSWIQGLWYNDATSTWTIEGAALEHGAFNTDSTNFPAGAVNAGKALLVVSGTSVFLRLINRTSPSTNSRTSWTYRAEVFYAW